MSVQVIGTTVPGVGARAATLRGGSQVMKRHRRGTPRVRAVNIVSARVSVPASVSSRGDQSRRRRPARVRTCRTVPLRTTSPNARPAKRAIGSTAGAGCALQPMVRTPQEPRRFNRSVPFATFAAATAAVPLPGPKSFAAATAACFRLRAAASPLEADQLMASPCAGVAWARGAGAGAG